MIFRDEEITIFFGDNSTAPFTGQEFKENIESNKVFLQERVSKFPITANKYIFLHQIHSIEGKIFTNNFNAFDLQSDYLVTQIPEVALGVLTADCLPIVFSDSVNRVVAVAHAGWRGSIDGISQKVINKLQEEFKTNLDNLKIYFGPSAKKCCYEVSEEFLVHSSDRIFEKSIISKNKKLFFDNVNYNRLKLMALGVQEERLNLNFSVCTICNLNFASHRRGAESAKRQVTLIKLNA